MASLPSPAVLPQLERLELEGSFGSTEWLAAVRSLRHLKIEDSDDSLLPVSPAISGLTALHSLHLEAGCSWLTRACRAASLTWL